MKSNSKRIIAILVALSMFFGLCACTNQISASDNDAEAQAIALAKEMPTHGKAVKKGEELQYIITNPIKSEEIKIDEYSNIKSGEYLRISGLKDKEVERSINRQIKDAFYELYDSEEGAPYQGFAVTKRHLDDIGYELKRNLWTYENFNAYNIYSVSMYKYDYFSAYDDYSNFGVSQRIQLNFDLNTGEQINLKDLFEDGFNYVSYINDDIRDYIVRCDDSEYGYDYRENNSVEFKGNFKTIAPDIKFCIGEYSGKLNLILDYETPFALLEDYSLEYAIDLGEHSAISQRFMSDKELYESEDYGIILLDDNVTIYEKDYYYDDSYDEIDNEVFDSIDLYSRMSIKKTAPKELIQIGKDFYSDKKFLKEIALYDANGANIPQNGTSVWADLFANTSKYMDYWELTTYKSINVYNYLKGIEINDSERHVYIYDSKNKKMITFEDLFNEGVDPKELFVKAAVKNFEETIDKRVGENRYDLESAYEVYGDKLKDLAGMLYDDINCFSLSSEALYFYYNDKEKVVEEFMGDACREDGGDRLNLLCDDFAGYLEYKNFGINNLVFIK